MKNFSYGYVKNYLEGRNLILLSKKYKNIRSRLKVKCEKDHIFKASLKSIQNNVNGCPECRKKILSKKFRHNYENIKKYIENEGYKLISDTYINQNRKLKVQCPKHHIYKTTFSNFKSGKRCPVCENKKSSSYGEKQVLKYIRSIYPNKIISNDRTTVLNPLTEHYLELDIYLPDIKKAIEYNGDY